jgi:hypothetical protein
MNSRSFHALLTAILLLVLGSSCYFPTGATNVDNSVGTPSLTSATIAHNRLVIEGTYLHKVHKITISGHGVITNFNLITQDFKNLSATAASSLALTAGALYNLVLTNANGDTTFPISMTAETPDPYFSAPSLYYRSINNSGIGTTYPIERLDVTGDIRIGGQATTHNGTTTEQAMLSLYNYNYGIAKFTDTGVRVFTNSGTDMQFGITTTPWPYSGGGFPYLVTESTFQPKMTIASTGHVGIGTAVPLGQLDIRHNNVTVNNPLGATAPGIFTGDIQTTDVGGSLMLGGLASASTVPVPFAGISGRKENSTSGNVAGYLQFATQSSAGSMAEGMRITSMGNVGIGVTNPSSILQVGNAGRLRISDGTSSDYTLLGTLNADGATNTRIVLSANSRAGGAGNIEYVGTNTGSHIWYTTNSTTERMRLSNSGYLGLGVTSPNNQFQINSYTSGSNNGGMYSGVSGNSTAMIVSPGDNLNLDLGKHEGTLALYNGASGASSRGGSLSLGGRNQTNYGGGFMLMTFGRIAGVQSAAASSYEGDLVFETQNAGAISERMRIDFNGNVGIGTSYPGYKLTVNGQPAANGYTAFTNYSDRRLKKDIHPLESGMLSKILQLNPSRFSYNDKYFDLTGYEKSGPSVDMRGFIAQELQTVFPEMVHKKTIGGESYLDTNLSFLQIYLTQAIKEFYNHFINTTDALDKEIDTLKAKVAASELENNEIKARLKKIELLMQTKIKN